MSNLTKREFLKRAGFFGLAVVGAGALMNSCGGGEKAADGGSKCNDLSGLTEDEKKLRANYEYITVTKDAAKNCQNCQFYTAPANAGDCGGCQLFKGPVEANGWCKTWVQKAG